MAGHQVDFDLGHVRNPQHRIIIEIGLLHLAVLDGDFVVERRSEPEHHATFDLRSHQIRVNDLAAIHRDDDPVHVQGSVFCDCHFRDVRHIAAESVEASNAAAAPCR